MIYDQLYDYQVEAADKIEAQRRIGLFDEPGLGKTFMALGAVERAGLLKDDGIHRTLVLATKTGAALTWLPHIIDNTDPSVEVLNAVDGPLPRRRKQIMMDDTSVAGPLVVVANHALIETKRGESLAHELKRVFWDAVIIDESHKVLPTRVERDRERTQFWTGLLQLNIKPSAIRLAMSGTPDRGHLDYRYGTYKFLLPEAYADDVLPYGRWLVRNFVIGYRRVPVRTRMGLKYVDQPYPVELKSKVRQQWIDLEQSLSIRRTKAEVKASLPPKRYIDVDLPFPLAQARAYAEYKHDAESGDDGTTRSADTFLVRATQYAAAEYEIVDGEGIPKPGGSSAKRDWLVDWLVARGHGDPELAGGGKVVVASQFSRLLHWLQSELAMQGIPASVLDGSLSTKRRLEVQKAFQEDPEARIVLLSMSLGDSIDLDAADDLIFFSMVQDPDTTTQTEDRVHRVSRDHQVTIWRLRSRGTVDEVISGKNDEQYHLQRELMDGSRGVEFERQILARVPISDPLQQYQAR